MEPITERPDLDADRQPRQRDDDRRITLPEHLDVNGNQRENVDFRGVYCSLLEQWFGHDAAAVSPTPTVSPATSC